MRRYRDLTMIAGPTHMTLCASCGSRLSAAQQVKIDLDEEADPLDPCASCADAWAERRAAGAGMAPDVPLTLIVDGGCVGGNPSPVGVTWAYRIVAPAPSAPFGLPVRQRAGFVAAQEFPVGRGGAPEGTNNHAELEALLQGLEALADGRIVRALWSDSNVTLLRLRGAKLANVPDWQVARLERQRERIADGRLVVRRQVLTAGHATVPELIAGKDRRGLPTTPHNSWCDAACTWVGQAVAGGLIAASRAVIRDEHILIPDAFLSDGAVDPTADRLIPPDDKLAELTV